MKRSTIIVVLVLLTGSVALGATWMFRSPEVDPAVAQLEQKAQQMFQQGQTMTDDQRREAWTQMRQSMDQLTPEQRDQFRDRQRSEWMKREDEQLRKFFALSKQDQIKELDKRINEREARRKRRDQQRNRGDDRTANRADRGDRGGRGGPGGPGSGGPGGGGPGGRGDRMANATGAERNQWRVQMLNNTTPQQRAMRDEYRRMYDSRRQQRGMG